MGGDGVQGLVFSMFINLVLRRVRKIAGSDYQFRHVCPSFLSHGTTRLPIEGILEYLIFDYFLKICLEN